MPPSVEGRSQHTTFDDEDLEVGVESVDESVGERTPPEEDAASDSGSDVEEVATGSLRKQARDSAAAELERRTAVNAQRRAREQRRAQAAPVRRKRRVAVEHDDAVEDNTPAPARLDPALFAAAFAHKDAAARAALAPTPAPVRRVARGRDGQPIVRVHGGSTVIRALAPERDAEVEDTPLEHTALDRGRALPTARERGFRKRKLGLRAHDIRATAIDLPTPKPAPVKKDTHDPLGLADPAFLPGGEYAHLGARPRSQRTKAPPKHTTTARGAGGRVQAPQAHRMGPAPNFARTR